MDKIRVNTGAPYYGIIDTITGRYVVPGWIQVPLNTTRDMIELETPVPVKKKVTTTKSWAVAASKPGTHYEVTLNNSHWECTCPARKFHAGECKHIKKIKSEIS